MSINRSSAFIHRFSFLLFFWTSYITGVLGFSIHRNEVLRLQGRQSQVVHSMVHSKFYQMEELEDAESCITEIYLRPDMTVDIGETDGPRFQSASGEWQTFEDGSFKMTLRRTYSAGREATEPTAIGTFSFEVERQFIGELTKIGDILGVTGTIVLIDELLGNTHVGFFNLLDTTAARENNGMESTIGRTVKSF